VSERKMDDVPCRVCKAPCSGTSVDEYPGNGVEGRCDKCFDFSRRDSQGYPKRRGDAPRTEKA
jgi:hypothetical protein